MNEGSSPKRIVIIMLTCIINIIIIIIAALLHYSFLSSIADNLIHDPANCPLRLQVAAAEESPAFPLPSINSVTGSAESDLRLQFLSLITSLPRYTASQLKQIHNEATEAAIVAAREKEKWLQFQRLQEEVKLIEQLEEIIAIQTQRQQDDQLLIQQQTPHLDSQPLFHSVSTKLPSNCLSTLLFLVPATFIILLFCRKFINNNYIIPHIRESRSQLKYSEKRKDNRQQLKRRSSRSVEGSLNIDKVLEEEWNRIRSQPQNYYISTIQIVGDNGSFPGLDQNGTMTICNPVTSFDNPKADLKSSDELADQQLQLYPSPEPLSSTLRPLVSIVSHSSIHSKVRKSGECSSDVPWLSISERNDDD